MNMVCCGGKTRRRGRNKTDPSYNRHRHSRINCCVFVFLLILNLILALLGVCIAGFMLWLITGDIGGFVTKERNRTEMMAFTDRLLNGLLGSGCTLLILAAIGLFLVASRLRVIAVAYAVLMFCFLFVEIVPFMMLFSNSDDHGGDVRDMLTEMLVEKYRGSDPFGVHKNTYSYIVDALQVKMKCCGIDSYKDFEKTSGEWKRNALSERGFEFKIPVSCCHFIIKNEDYDNMKVKQPRCIFEPTEQNSWIGRGCYSQIVRFVQSNYWVIVLAFWIVIIIQIICIVLALVYWFRERRREKEDQASSETDSVTRRYKETPGYDSRGKPPDFRQPEGEKLILSDPIAGPSYVHASAPLTFDTAPYRHAGTGKV